MTIFDYETLTKLGARLFDHADRITSVAAHEMEVDIRSAARVCSNLATLRFRIAEIADRALTQAGAAIRRDLLDAIAALSSRYAAKSMGTGPAYHRPFFVSYSVAASLFALPLDDDLIGFDVLQINAELA
jgi:hypothetical protein